MQYLIITLLFIIFAYPIYFLWIKPVRTIKGYVKNLRDRGYKVLQVPFNPFKNDMITCMRKGREQGDALKLFKQERRDYDVIVSNTLNRPRLQFHHPDFIKDYFSIDKHFQFPKTQNVARVYERIAGRGITFKEGPAWKKSRTILNKVFNFDFVKAQTNQIAKICNQALVQIQNKSKQNQNENSVTYNIVKFTVRVFSTVMISSFIGGETNLEIGSIPAAQFLRKLINDINVQSFTPLNFILGPKILKLGITKKQRQIQKRIQQYRAWGVQYIKKRVHQIKENLKNNQSKLQHTNIIQALVLANIAAEKQNTAQQILSIQQIFQQFTAFFIAGTDTTANYTQMMIYQIARHPEIQAKVRQQIQKYFPNENQQNYNYENLKRLTYIQLVQKQITRTYGPLNLLFSRQTKCDTYLNDVPIKKGTGLSIFYVSNHYSQKYFKNPQQFRPQRWINECDNIPSFAIGGFSAGARTCLGKHLALLQSKIALVKFLKRYKKIILGKQNFAMVQKFMYAPEQFQSTMIFKQQQKTKQNGCLQQIHNKSKSSEQHTTVKAKNQ